MPKDEFDFEDPFELNGVTFLTEQDTTDPMAECFIEEYMRMGYNHKQVLALFRNPQYLGPHMALERRGEPFIRNLIEDIFARWGKAVAWPEQPEPAEVPGSTADAQQSSSLEAGGAEPAADDNLTDPTGAPIPKLNL